MRLRIAIAVLFALCALPLPARASELLDAIDRAYQTGSLDRFERQWLRVAAIRAPDRLPEPWRTLARQPSAHQGQQRAATDAAPAAPLRTALGSLEQRCPTPVLVEAYQALPTLEPARASSLRDLLSPPTDLAYTVETTTPYPMRVSYAEPSQQARAEHVLAAAITSYERIVDELGFWAPPIEPGLEYYRFFLMSAGDAAGYTSPYGPNDATLHSDSFSYIVIDPGLDDLSLDITVAHEFNHATQAAMDASEVVSFWENTATVIESEVFPIGWAYTTGTFHYFQSQPYRPLEYMNMSSSDLYEYGGSLWAHFLREQYGGGEPAFLREIWEGSVQNGYQNEPDYFDVIDELLAAEGGMPAAARTFAEARFFVGYDDDGQHLADANHWGDAEPWESARHNRTQLPILDAGPQSEESRPQPNGCNYVRMSTVGATMPLRVSFQGLGGLPWEVRAFLTTSTAPTRTEALALDDDGAGKLAVPVEDVEQLVLAICQIAPEGYDPDARSWPKGDYRYSIEYDVPPPVVDEVVPAEIEQGAHGVELTVLGSGFVAGAELAVRAGGSRVLLELVERTSATELRVRAVVAPDAPLGPLDVIVTNAGGAETTGSELLTVVAPAPPGAPPEPPPDEEGCACRAGGPGHPPGGFGALWVTLAVAGAAWMRGRHRATAGPRANRWHRSPLAVASTVAAAVAWLPQHASAQPAWTDVVQSQSRPIRVHYPDTVTSSAAEEVLAYAEQAWVTQVEQMGFPAPTTVDENGERTEGLWLYLDPDQQYDHAEPIGDNPDTPWTDCTMRVVIGTLSPAWYVPLAVAHETNHALEMSADCGESNFAYENTTVAVGALSFADEPLFPQYFLPTFQANPHRGLDCVFWSSEEMYYFHYGAALFQLYLEDAHGTYDGTLLASLWEAAKQNGAVTSVTSGGANLSVENEPDLLDAVQLVLPDVGIDGALTEFARWRYFVGDRDDGAHFRDAAKWSGSEVTVDRSVEPWELPVEQAAPTNPPNELGSVYVELDLTGFVATDGLRIAFSGDPTARWNADVLLVRSDRTSDDHAVPLDETGAGALQLTEVTDYTRAVLVVTNLGVEGHDPDRLHCSISYPFSYGLYREDLALAPVVSEVSPSELRVGEAAYLWIYGAQFDVGTTVSFEGAGMMLDRLDRIDDTLLGAELRIDAEAPPGPRAMTVRSAAGQTTTVTDAVTLVVAQRARGPALEPGGGCVCTVGSHDHGSDAPPLAAALAGLALALGRQRRPAPALDGAARR